MKRLQYISRFTWPLSEEEIAGISKLAGANNLEQDITGFLVCLGNSFFQLLEGADEAVDHLFHEHISKDNRHTNIICLKTENNIEERYFPEWSMQVFNLNAPNDLLPRAFESVFNTLLDSYNIISRYTQPSIFDILENGIDPTTLLPQRIEKVVFFSDIAGFSMLSERLSPNIIIDLVNCHVDICSDVLSNHGGEINKLIGDGVLGCFPPDQTDDAIDACLEILEEMKKSRDSAPVGSALKVLYNGMSLAQGSVVEGNVGSSIKKDYTLIGDVVNLASRLQSLTREIGTPLVFSENVVKGSSGIREFVYLGEHHLKGKQNPQNVYSLKILEGLDIRSAYEEITSLLGRR